MTDESEYGFPVVEDRTEEVSCELATKNRKRYEDQAIQLLKDSTLEVHIENAILRYFYKDPYVESELSFDQGKNFRWLEKSRLSETEAQKLLQLFWEFAFSEARALLER